MKYQDDTIIDFDANTLDRSLLDHNNESIYDNIQKVMSKDMHDTEYLSNLKQQDIPGERDTVSTKPLSERHTLCLTRNTKSIQKRSEMCS